MKDDEIAEYINSALFEQMLQILENDILRILKLRYEKYPTNENDKEWLDYTNFICGKRCKRVRDKCDVE